MKLVLRLKSNECSSKLSSDAPPEKKRRLSLHLKKPSRFSFTTLKDVQEGQKVVVPEITHGAIQWSLHVLQTWQSQRNETFPEEQCPEDILRTDNAGTVSYCLCYFCKEARKANGEAHTPHAISQILAGLLRYACDRRSKIL